MEDPATPQDRFASEGTSRLDDVARLLREEAICAMKAEPPDMGRVKELMDVYERIRREAAIPPVDSGNTIEEAVGREIERGLREDAAGYVSAAGPRRLRGAFPPMPNAQERILDRIVEIGQDYFHEYKKVREGPPERRAMTMLRLAERFEKAAGVDATVECQDLREAAKICRAQAVATVSAGTELARRAIDGVLHHDMARGPDFGEEGCELHPHDGRETHDR